MHFKTSLLYLPNPKNSLTASSRASPWGTNMPTIHALRFSARGGSLRCGRARRIFGEHGKSEEEFRGRRDARYLVRSTSNSSTKVDKIVTNMEYLETTTTVESIIFLIRVNRTPLAWGAGSFRPRHGRSYGGEAFLITST